MKVYLVWLEEYGWDSTSHEPYDNTELKAGFQSLESARKYKDALILEAIEKVNNATVEDSKYYEDYTFIFEDSYEAEGPDINIYIQTLEVRK